MVQYTPYTSDMSLGQGYNTFVQEVAMNGAVTVTSGETPSARYSKTYDAALVTDYRRLTESLNINGSGAISGWGQSGRVNVDYLDRKEFESSDITYEVKVDIEHQGRATNQYSFNWTSPPDPNSAYGDCFIADFIKGGHYYALVRITSKSEAHRQEVEQAAEVTMSMYGVTGTITEEVKTALSTLAKYSKITIAIDESGSGTNLLEAATGKMDLEAVKKAADDFYKHAESKGYIRCAILEKYENISNFKNEFTPFDYFNAIQKSYPFLDEFSRYMSFRSLIDDVPGIKFIGGQPRKDELQQERVAQVEQIRNKILEIRDNPNKADFTLPRPGASEFWTDVLCAVTTAKYIAQRVPTPKGGYSDRIQATLQSGATRLFDVNVYDFDSLEGTRLVSFGSDERNDSYIAVIDMHANSIPGWKEDSYFYVFTQDIAKVTGDLIRVSSLTTKNYIRLARQTSYSVPMFKREIKVQSPFGVGSSLLRAGLSTIGAGGGDLFTFCGGNA